MIFLTMNDSQIIQDAIDAIDAIDFNDVELFGNVRNPNW